MKRLRHPLFALLLSLLLVFSQQAAFAHLLSHLPGGAEAVAQVQNDHGSLDGAAETCTTCIAFAGVAGGAPPSSAATSIAVFTNGDDLLPIASPVSARPATGNRARAPPAVL